MPPDSSDISPKLPPWIAPFILRGNEPQPQHPRSDDRLGDEHSHKNTWLLFGVTDGTLEFWERGKRPVSQVLRAGQIMLLHSDKKRYWDESNAHYRFIEFDLIGGFNTYEKRSHSAWQRKEGFPFVGPQPTTSSDWKDYLRELPPTRLTDSAHSTLRWCCDRWWRSEGMRLQAQARLGSLLAEWACDTLDSNSQREDQFTGVEHEARRRIPTGFNVADMAAYAGLSRALFSRLYLQARGRSPGKFLRELRLELAVELLPNPAWPIKRIARHVGYRSAVTFSRAFREAYQCSPQKWRANHRS